VTAGQPTGGLFWMKRIFHAGGKITGENPLDEKGARKKGECGQQKDCRLNIGTFAADIKH
jgi:hypothetical protein